MSNVLSFPSKKEEPVEEVEPTGEGPAFCFRCDHEWHAVAPVGTEHLQCPACLTYKGRYRYEFQPQEPVYTCEACTNQLYYLTPDGHLCANCGLYNEY